MKRRGHKAPVTKKLFLSWLDRTGDCWIWQRSCIPGGYGALVLVGGERWIAHRFAYEMFVGLIPKGRLVLHECDTPPCCNPKHLFLGDHNSNAQDKVRKGRQARGENHGSARLTEKDVKAIRADSRPFKEIAAEYGVRADHIRDIRKRKRWRCVE